MPWISNLKPIPVSNWFISIFFSIHLLSSHLIEIAIIKTDISTNNRLVSQEEKYSKLEGKCGWKSNQCSIAFSLSNGMIRSPSTNIIVTTVWTSPSSAKWYSNSTTFETPFHELITCVPGRHSRAEVWSSTSTVCVSIISKNNNEIKTQAQFLLFLLHSENKEPHFSNRCPIHTITPKMFIHRSNYEISD